jgi:uncharacterized protein YndB with AHSA1/START domain
MTNQRVVVAAPGTHTISFAREFEAPAARVFAAHVDPELVPRWIGPRGTSVEMRHFDPRTGGRWSYVVVGLGGRWPFHGSFHEVTAPNRLVQTFEYEDQPGHPSLDVLSFVDLPGGRSRIEGLTAYLSIEDRDAQADLDSGRDEDFDRLEELLAAAPVAS